jgi:hypothetical protein
LQLRRRADALGGYTPGAAVWVPGWVGLAAIHLTAVPRRASLL